MTLAAAIIKYAEVVIIISRFIKLLLNLPHRQTWGCAARRGLGSDIVGTWLAEKICPENGTLPHQTSDYTL
jgi:hypothetical protein